MGCAVGLPDMDLGPARAYLVKVKYPSGQGEGIGFSGKGLAKQQGIVRFIAKKDILEHKMPEPFQVDTPNGKLGLAPRNHPLGNGIDYPALNQRALENKVSGREDQHHQRQGNKCYFKAFFDIFVLRKSTFTK